MLPPMLRRALPRLLALLAIAAAIATPAPSHAEPHIRTPFPDSPRIEGRPVTFPSHSPFTIAQVGTPDDVPTAAVATLFLPADAGREARVPGVVLLHGSGGVLGNRELTYGRQLAGMGVAALVVDAFAARRDRATSYTERLIEITETMLMADAYAGLDYLAGLPGVDGNRVALVGFSYGAMATMYALQEQVAAKLEPGGRRFVGHVSYYGPCIATFQDQRTTGAPLLTMAGGRDALIDQERCREVVGRIEAGGSRTRTVIYPEAVHQWDGGFGAPRTIGRDLSDCRLEVEADGTTRDLRTTLPMIDTFTRKIILGLCVSSDGYLIGRDDAVRAKSDEELARFLNAVFEG